MNPQGSQTGRRLAGLDQPLRFYLTTAAVVVIGVPLTLLSPEPIVTLVAIGAAILGFILPVRYVALAWGFILPIYATVNVAPVWFDAARLAGAVLIGVRLQAERSSKMFQRITIPLLAAGSMQFVGGLMTPREDPTQGAFVLVSAVVGLVIAVRPSIYRPVLGGFSAGATLSGIVVLMQVMELPNPALPLIGYGRFQGLSASGVRGSVEMSVAGLLLCVWLLHARARPMLIRLIALLAALICLIALLASGGRGGLLGLGLAVIIAVRQKLLRPRHLVAVAALVCGVLYLADRNGLALSTLDRITGKAGGATDPDITTGRADLFWQALHETFAHPILGMGAISFQSTYGHLPHVAPLTLAVSGGIIGAVAGIWLLGGLMVNTFAKSSAGAPWQVGAGRCLASILLLMSFLDVNGPFLGAAVVTILFLSLGLTHPVSIFGAIPRSISSRSNHCVDDTPCTTNPAAEPQTPQGRAASSTNPHLTAWSVS